ncbi:hypothetical protein SBRY_90301 [Actinacidiphila bryophytorum]|uniref:Uncharacterized protein n=1 Tax=Actinacidiphila bryophytorum TaxID=1436133 RepID=A0A9W4H7X7_9ACTN|nr:hypothetical protein SBRY_90301 [Actinacidiphila bryophytorum]
MWVQSGGEQGSECHFGGQFEHGLGEVEDRTVLPVGGGRRYLPAHHLDVAAQMLVPEGGLHHQSLPAVIVVSGGRETGAHGLAHFVVDRAGAVEAPEVGQYFVGHVRVAGHVRAPRAEAYLRQVPVCGQGFQESQGVALQSQDVTYYREVPGYPPEPCAVIAQCRAPFLLVWSRSCSPLLSFPVPPNHAGRGVVLPSPCSTATACGAAVVKARGGRAMPWGGAAVESGWSP